MSKVPSLRVTRCNDAPVAGGGDYVLYWMIAARRVSWNFALDHAVSLAEELGKPLVILEALRHGYRWASDRLHAFVLDGMADTAKALARAPVFYYPFVERGADEGKGLVAALAAKACVVVTDDFPCFFLPRMVHAASRRLPIRLDAVDSNGILPMRAATQCFPTAFAFRRFLQATLREPLAQRPAEKPFAGSRIPRLARLPAEITRRWPPAAKSVLSRPASTLAELPIDHSVGGAALRGGAGEASRVLAQFVEKRLPTYAEQRNEPEREATSGLSPFLHFGHVSAHEVFWKVAAAEEWTPERLVAKAAGKRSGWWGMSESAEAFLDQLITWRELGFNMCSQRADFDRFDALPDWARTTLGKHERDERKFVYQLADFEAAGTHDRLWNAAQTQLLREGRIHNYLRMLWGKKILEWSPTPREALDILIELNNKYALDGRDPNSYSGIFWCLGRYDRPWGPERPVFGTVRYMSSDNTARKYDVKGYLSRYAPEAPAK